MLNDRYRLALAARCWILSVLVILWFGLSAAAGQEAAAPGNADSLYYQARATAVRQHNYEKAIQLCRDLLGKYPDYYDAWILMGRSYAGLGLYSRAEQQLHFVLQDAPDYEEAFHALVDVYRGWGRLDMALQTANKGLQLYPDDADLLYKKALLQHRLGDKEGALRTLSHLREVSTLSREAMQLYRNITGEMHSQELTVLYRHDRFAAAGRSDIYLPWDETNAPWRFVHVGYSQVAKQVTLLGQLQYAQRFGQEAVQAEIGVCPKLTRSTTGYLNIGYSPDPLFPQIRAGGEITQTLGDGFQVSVGARYLDFNADQVTLYTGALSQEIGNYRIYARGFFSQSKVAFDQAWYAQIRRYFHGPDTYITISGGIGPSPDQPDSKEVYQYLTTRHFAVGGQQRVAGFTYIRWELQLANEEWERATFRAHATGILGLVYRF